MPRKPAPKKPVRRRRLKKGSPQATARARAVAGMAAAGTPTVEIAAAIETTPTHVRRILNCGETQRFFGRLVIRHEDLIFSLLEESFRVLREAMQADRADVHTKDGAIFPGGPDHYARLAAVQRFIQLSTAGRPVPKAPDVGPTRPRLSLLDIDGPAKEPLSAPDPRSSH